MALDEEALKEFIAQLPDLDVEHEASGLGEEERLYVRGVTDAYRVLRGETPAADGMADVLREHAERFRVPHAPEWAPLAQGASYCKVCEIRQDEGDVPWHTSPA